MNDTLAIINQRKARITFIKEDDIKVYTPMSANKSQSTLIGHIVVSQDLHIKKILGATLFGRLMAEWIFRNQVAADLPDGTPSGNSPIVSGDLTNYQELHEQIFKPLVWWSYTLSLSTIAINVGEAGLLLRSTENAESGGIDGLKKLVAESEGTARAYTAELLEYIEETFKNNQAVQDESEETGAPSAGVFVAKKPWHGNNSNY